MKKTLAIGILCIFVILLSISLCGCSQNTIQNTDTYLSNQDSQYNFIFEDMCQGNIAEAPNGYYFLSGTTINYLYYFDDATKKACPVSASR